MPSHAQNVSVSTVSLASILTARAQVLLHASTAKNITRSYTSKNRPKLLRETISVSNLPPTPAPAPAQPASPLVGLTSGSIEGQTLLATALISVPSSRNRNLSCRALLDSGSMTSFITESCVQRLGLKRQRHSVTIYGIGGNVSSKANGYVIVPLDTYSNGLSVDCVILPQLTRTLPSEFRPISQLATLSQLRLADHISTCQDQST